MSNPRERAANLEKLTELLQRVQAKLEPKQKYATDGRLLRTEGRNEDLELFDEETLRFFGRDSDEDLLAAAESSPFIRLLERVCRAATARRQELLGMPRAKRRQPQKMLENELAELWCQYFDERPPATPEGVFAEVLKMVSNRRYTPKARQSATERARQNLDSDK